MSDNPIYIKWVYSPNTDNVTIAHYKETHPAFTRTHSDLANEVNDHHATHGFAFKIGNGWRILDYDFGPLEDPYVKEKVAKELRDTFHRVDK